MCVCVFFFVFYLFFLLALSEVRESELGDIYIRREITFLPLSCLLYVGFACPSAIQLSDFSVRS